MAFLFFGVDFLDSLSFLFCFGALLTDSFFNLNASDSLNDQSDRFLRNGQQLAIVQFIRSIKVAGDHFVQSDPFHQIDGRDEKE